MAQSTGAPTKIFINLPVKDLNKSIDFFTKLGFEFNQQFTDENATCMIVNEDAAVMLLVEDFFKSFISKELVDATKSTETLVCLSANSRDEVNDLVNKALEAGGSKAGDPIDQGPMYGWSFQDPDGHHWEVMYMDPSVLES